MNANINLSKVDFVSDQEVRWCPGCGDYAILASLQKILPMLNIPKENFVFISGIGCAGRLPYYLNTYGFHTIHGRAPAVATGLKMLRPELSVWVITGDGDALSIGGNHFIHLMRRNPDLVILLLNNQIYGLTKGQYSPTSELGKVTHTSPLGTMENPFNPLAIALAAGASFVARALDTDTKHLQEILLAAAMHRGTALVEVYQNCHIFNDQAYGGFAEKSVRADRMIYLTSGEPLLFGSHSEKALTLEGLKIKIVDASERDKWLYHDPQQASVAYSQLLAALSYPDYPVPLGILRAVERPTLEENCQQLQAKHEGLHPRKTLSDLFAEGHTWEVK